MENMELTYNDQAKNSGIYIVNSCGFSSIPIEMGILFTQSKFKGTINSVETFFDASVNTSGPSIHFGTWASAIYGFAHAKELKSLRLQLYPKKLPDLKPKLKKR